MSASLEQVARQREHTPVRALLANQSIWVTIALAIICLVMAQVSNVFCDGGQPVQHHAQLLLHRHHRAGDDGGHHHPRHRSVGGVGRGVVGHGDRHGSLRRPLLVVGDALGSAYGARLRAGERRADRVPESVLFHRDAGHVRGGPQPGAGVVAEPHDLRVRPGREDLLHHRRRHAVRDGQPVRRLAGPDRDLHGRLALHVLGTLGVCHRRQRAGGAPDRRRRSTGSRCRCTCCRA